MQLFIFTIFGDTRSAMEFHGAAHAIEMEKIKVSRNSMELDGATGVSDIGKLNVWSNSIEFYAIHGYPLWMTPMVPWTSIQNDLW